MSVVEELRALFANCVIVGANYSTQEALENLEKDVLARVQKLEDSLKMYKHKRRGISNSSNWRYCIIKGYKHRAQKFAEKASTPLENEVWAKVIDWFDSILKKRRFTKNAAIGIPKAETDFIHRKELEKLEGRFAKIRKQVMLIIGIIALRDRWDKELSPKINYNLHEQRFEKLEKEVKKLEGLVGET